MNKVLITGGAGFIGFHLAKKLSTNGYQVDILDNFERAVSDPDLEKLLHSESVKLIEKNLLDSDVINNLDIDYDYIFHFAAIIGVGHVLKRPYDVLTFNVDLLKNVISLSTKQNNLKRLVFASTSEIYAGTLKYFELPIPTSELTPLAISDLSEPRTSYMLSKIYGEAMCHQSGLPFTIIRPHNIYGPRMGLSHVIPELLKKARELKDGEKLQVYSVNHNRTFCYIDDAVILLENIIKNSDCNNMVFNLGKESPEITIYELAKIVLKIVGKANIEIEAMPETPGSPSRRRPDMDKLTSIINVEANIDLEKGVSRTWDWYERYIFRGDGISAK